MAKCVVGLLCDRELTREFGNVSREGVEKNAKETEDIHLSLLSN